ncbi:hypothetical protein K440DRAFT_636709 [Wilcoxina mikolae CBS 423.85]|nr:hypothetical protein K440DRAFT_636709 [Wilcoxina mikolae CBS 423.85]
MDSLGRLINYSLASRRSYLLNDHVDETIELFNVSLCAAAGKSALDALALSDLSITVGATTQRDTRLPASNCGDSVDIQAPCEKIRSAFIDQKGKGSLTKSLKQSGTSQVLDKAFAYIIGICAFIFSKEGYYNYADWKPCLLEIATLGAINGLDQSTPNRLAYNGVHV